MSAPAEHIASRARSVDGHPLPIDELNGTKPTEKIDLSGKGLYDDSAIIIASCIKGNGSLKELMCAAFPQQFPANMSGPHEHFRHAAPWPRSAGLVRTISAWKAPRRSPPCSRTLSCLRWGALLPQIYTRPVRVDPP